MNILNSYMQKHIRFAIAAIFILISFPFVLQSQCNDLYITWIGVIDNGEGDKWPHGPYGNLHLQLYDCDGREVDHFVLEGPSKKEFRDGDEAFYCIKINSGSCVNYIKIWESDTNKWGGINWKAIARRKHDVLFSGVPNSPGIWESGRPAKDDAVRNVQRRGNIRWIDNVSGNIRRGMPSLYVRVDCGC